MELREPPKTRTESRGSAPGWLSLAVALVALLAVGGLLWRDRDAGEAADVEHLREVASKLRAAGALEESARVLDEYLTRLPEASLTRANMAYTLGQTYLDLGETERGLRWFYEAESLADGALREELGRKIVHSLERLGRFHAAQAALDSRVRLAGAASPEGEVRRAEDDPVVAQLGEETIRRSEVERAIDELPPQLAQSLRGAEARRQFLQQYGAEELLWRKAKKLEYDQDPEVRRQLERLWRQLAMSKFVEQEVVAGIEVDESDLRNFFTANKERYRAASTNGGEAPEPEFEEARDAVEADYRQQKIRTAYDELLASQLATEDVQVFAERMGDG